MPANFSAKFCVLCLFSTFVHQFYGAHFPLFSVNLAIILQNVMSQQIKVCNSIAKYNLVCQFCIRKK